MAASDRPEQDELNKIMKIDEWDEWEDFLLGCDPAWHEHKGPIKQDDD